MRCVDVKDVDMRFGTNTVLSGTTLHVDEGEIFGLLGPSGAGKTTLIRILTGLLPPTAGSGTVLGDPLGALSDNVLLQLGILAETSGFYPRLSCNDNLRVFAMLYGLDTRIIPTLLRMVGLENAAQTTASSLSTGQRQRLLLSRAIMHRPRLLFLDEPTSGLDPQTAVHIRRLVVDLRDHGMTVLLTTHNMQEASELCDRVALLNHGHIVEEGPPKELCEKYNTSNRLRLQTVDGTDLTLPNGPESADVIAGLLRRSRITSIHSTEPDLGRVFLDLTGEDLDHHE